MTRLAAVIVVPGSSTVVGGTFSGWTAISVGSLTWPVESQPTRIPRASGSWDRQPFQD